MKDEPEQIILSRHEIGEIRRRHRANIPDLRTGAYRRLWDKALAGRDLRAAIKSKCLDCMNWQATEVRACTCPACPLYPYRITGRKIPKAAACAATSDETP